MRRLVLLIAVAALLGATVATVATTNAGAIGQRAKATKLRAKPFSSCARLVKYARRHAKKELRVANGPVVAPGSGLPEDSRGPSPSPGAGGDGQSTGAPEAAPPPATDDTSGTNVQEQGVDEPDFVKTNGDTIFALANGRLNAVDARAATPKLLQSLDVGVYGGELLLRGKRLLLISYAPSPVEILPPQPGSQGGPQGQPDSAPPPDSGGGGSGSGVAVSPGIAYYRPATLITEIDVTDPADMKVVRTETIDGSYVSARQNGNTARIVLTTPPAGLDYGQEDLRAKPRGWLPRARLENLRTGKKKTRRILPCGHVRRPRVFAGLDVLTVLTIDMRKGLPAIDTDALMTDGQTVYASNDGLYVATQRFVAPPETASELPPPLTTAIHKFDISDPGRTAYSASGGVTGYVLGQFALSEYKGVLRVASTDSPVWWPSRARPESESLVTTLKQSGDVLLPLGRVGGLGLGEQIRGVRFIAEAGYIVTFRQTDPLYTIDLSKPSDPTVAGELKLLGYSAYLHPVADGLLLGVGQDATDQGRQLGTQLSLFDVSDLAHPARLAQRRVGSSSSSEAEFDHHAFLYWPPEKLAVLPVTIYEGRESSPFLGAIGFRVGRTSIGEVGRVQHDGSNQYYAPIRRSVVVGPRLFTISDLGAKASTLSSLADESFVPFPVPDYGGGGGAGGNPGAEDGGPPSPGKP